MKVNRRKFLTATGLTALAASCSPPVLMSQPLSVMTVHEQLRKLQYEGLQKQLLLGYPINMKTPPEAFFEWRKQFMASGLNRFAFNNVGNPYDKSPIPFNSHQFEKALINRFAAVYGFAQDDVWGFLTNSGTDSNMHGLYMGRTILKKRTGVFPKIYFTQEAHYSIQILSDVLNLEVVIVNTDSQGSMDVADLENKLAGNANQPALVVATIGTTFKGAIDPIDEIQRKLSNRESYLHLDAALFGGYLPHTSFASDLLQRRVDREPSNIRWHRYDSIAVSCHKFFGFPSPAGLFITTQKNFEEFLTPFSKIHDPEYILQVPGMITCSRDAVKPAEFYFFSSESAFAQQAQDASTMLENTRYLYQEMKTNYANLQPTRVSEKSNIVYFRKPKDTIISKYSLAVMRVNQEGKRVPYAHVVVMPHVEKLVLDQFLTDLNKTRF